MHRTTDTLKADMLSALVVQRFRDAQMWRKQQQILNCSVEEWIGRVSRAMNKTHESSERQNYPGMSGYFGLSMLKVHSAVSKLKTTYAHAIDAPFVLKASAEPELPPELREKVKSKLSTALLQQLNANGLVLADIKGKMSKMPEIERWLETKASQLDKSAREESTIMAKEAAAYHHSHMRKQMQDGGWLDAATLLFNDLVSMPYAVICANELMPRWDFKWAGSKAVRERILSPSFRRVAAQHAYHGSDSTSAQDGCGFSEVVFRTRKDMQELAKMSDQYIPEQIAAVLMHHDKRSLDWLGFGDASMMIDEKHPWEANSSQNIRCIVHQGVVSGAELAEYGHTGHGDEKDFHEATIEVCGNITIRVQPTNARRTYYSACYKKDSDSYAGPSVAMMLHDRQLEVNRLMFSKNRNAWHSSGPMVVLNGHYFQHPEDVRLDPFMTAHANPKNTTGQNWGVQQINVNPMFAQLHEEVRRVMVLADEECGVPSLFSGISRGGVSRTTLGGAVMEQTNGELGMNDAIIQLDTSIIQPMVKALHFSNLEDSSKTKKKHIRGDIEIEGRGIYALREKELQQRLYTQSLPMLMQTTQAGITPTPMLEGALKEYYANSGIDVTAMRSGAAQQEIASAGMNPPQGNDQRTFNPQQSMIGVNA